MIALSYPIKNRIRAMSGHENVVPMGSTRVRLASFDGREFTVSGCAVYLCLDCLQIFLSQTGPRGGFQ